MALLAGRLGSATYIAVNATAQADVGNQWAGLGWAVALEKKEDF